jgi:hypothetical protein
MLPPKLRPRDWLGVRDVDLEQNAEVSADGSRGRVKPFARQAAP